MFRKCCFGLFVSLLFCANATAQPGPALSLHAVNGIGSCGDIDPETIDCSDIATELQSPPNLVTVFVIASGVDALAGVQFGISFGSGIDVATFNACHNGSAVGESGWPALSGTGVAIGFPETVQAQGPNHLVVVGYFLLNSGSEGYIFLADAGQFGEAAWVTPEFALASFPDQNLGSVSIDGDDEEFGCNYCDIFNTRRFELEPDTGGLAPDWGRTLNRIDSPLAVTTVVCDECGESMSSSDPSGGVLAFLATKEDYWSVRFSREGDFLRTDHLDYRADYNTIIDGTRNRESLVATTPPSSEFEGRVYHAGTLTGGPISDDGNEWLLAATDPTHGDCRNVVDGRHRFSSEGDLVGAVFHHDSEEYVFTAGRLSVLGPPAGVRLEIRYRQDENSFPAGGTSNGRLYNVLIEEVLDAKLANAGTTENIYVLASRPETTDGFYVIRTTVDMSALPSGEPVLEGTLNTLTLDSTDDETSAVVAVDSNDNAVVAVTRDGTSSSTLTLMKLSPDMSEVWTIVLMSSSPGDMFIFDIAVDVSDNVYLAGRFEGNAAVVRFPTTPADEDDHLLYEVADGCAGSARALALDTESLSAKSSCLYVTGECDNPNDSSGENQMFVSSLDAANLDVEYEHFVDASEVPTETAGIGGAGVSIHAETDPYNDEDPAPYVYALGQIRHSGRESASSVLFRYSFGGCTTVAVEHASGTSTQAFAVRGGRVIRVGLNRPLAEDLVVHVFDVAGRVVSDVTIFAGNTEVVLAGLNSGAYFVRAVTADGNAYVGRAVVVR